MLLQTVRPNIVQAIRAYRVEDLMAAAEGGQRLLLDLRRARPPGPTLRHHRSTRVFVLRRLPLPLGRGRWVTGRRQ